MKKNIFLVDADNTILDFHKSSAVALIKATEDCGKTWKAEYSEIFTRFNDGLWARLEKKELTREVLIKCRFPIFLNLIGFEEISAIKFNERFLHYLATLPFYIEGAQKFLENLQKRGRVYIVTNGTTEIQKSRFSLCGLNDYCESVFVSETIGADKPSKKYTDYVLSHIENFEKSRTVWIGDSLSADIQAAKTAGIENILFNPNKQPIKNPPFPDFNAGSYAEILEILGI